MTGVQTCALPISSTETAQDRLLLADRASDAATLTDWAIPRLPLRGGDLIARGISEGPEIARTLRFIEGRWVAAGFPTGPAFAALVDAALS